MVCQFLEDYYSDARKDNYYTVQIVMDSDFLAVGGMVHFRTKTVKQMKLLDLVDEISSWMAVNNLKYNDNRVHQDIVKHFFIKRINPWFGSGKEFTLFRILGNAMVRVKFPKTRLKCLLVSVYQSLGIKKTTKDYKNYEKFYRDMPFDSVKMILEQKHNIKILITSSMKRLERNIAAWQPGTVLLFSLNSHLGSVHFETPDLPPSARDSYPVKALDDEFVSIRDIVVGSVDCEWSWEQLKDSKFSHVNLSPNLVGFTWIACGVKEQRVFPSFERFIVFLCAKTMDLQKPFYIYSHNGKRVEHQFLIYERIRQSLRKKQTPKIELKNIAGTSIKSFTWEFPGSKVKFIDSMLYMTMSLKNISRSYNLPCTKGHEDFLALNIPEDDPDYKEKQNQFYLNKKWDHRNPKDAAYVLEDTDICLQFCLKFNQQIQEIFKLGPDTWALCKPSVSAIDKTVIFNQYPELENTRDEALTFSEGYCGGRTEAFFRGEVVLQPNEKIFTQDINSSYPYQMRKGTAGQFLRTIRDQPFHIHLQQEPGTRRLHIATISYRTRYIIAPLAVKHEGVLIFPNIMNPRTLFLYDFEYDELKDNLNIFRIHATFVFKEMQFTCMDELFEMKSKMKSDPPAYTAIKVLINGMYGCLAMNLIRQQKQVLTNTEIDRKPNDVFLTTAIDDTHSWFASKEIISTKTCFQGAAFTTAQARMHLWKRIDMELRLGHKVLYCDTDSLYAVSDKSYQPEVTTELGGWDYEELDSLTVLGCKSLIKNNKLMCKGIIDTKKVVIPEDILETGLDYTNVEWKISFVDCKIYIATENKHASLRYNKGVTTSSGFVLPFDV